MAVDGYLLIVGAAKAGTSSLASWLATHPDILLPKEKEPNYFTRFAAGTWSGPLRRDRQWTEATEDVEYRVRFGPGDARWGIDGSADYLWSEGAAGRIRAFADSHPVRIVCLLRDPLDRAVSQWRHTLRDGFLHEPLGAAVALEEERREAGWHPLFWPVRRSRYHADVARYRRLFGADLLLLDFAELADPGRVLGRVTDLLGLPPVPPAPPGGFRVRNESRVILSPLGRRLAAARQTLGSAARMVPRPARATWRRLIERVGQTGFRPSEAELRAVAELLRDDIEACIADPEIPTASWTTSRRLLGLDTRRAAPLPA